MTIIINVILPDELLFIYFKLYKTIIISVHLYYVAKSL